ncbi:MAG TPA: flagellar hook-length control protein FliK [Pseudolabrys sp.]|nr:flagellar hook-length control protein FliK [Pseudolabrys sp.]
MPQVASDPKIHAPNHSLPRMARPAQQSDNAPSPFESLLDDSAQSAGQATPPSPENKAGFADSSQAPARNNECKPPATNDDAPAPKSDQVDDATLKPGDVVKAVCEGKADVNAKASTAAGETIKTDDNGEEPAGGPKADTPAIATPPTDNIQTISTAVVGLAPAPAPLTDQTPKPDPAGIKQPGQMAELVAAVGNDASTLKGLDPVDPKAGTGKQAAAEKKTDVETQFDTDFATPEAMADSQPAAKLTPQSHVAKPQFAPSDSDKEHITQARGEGVSDSHRNMDASPTLSGDPAGAAPNVSADASATSTMVSEPARTSLATTTPPAPVAPPGGLPAGIPFGGLAVEIAGRAIAGKNRFEIRLDPPELGRIEVRLDVDRDGNVTSRLTVDRADTFDLLRRDAAGLERALQDAGLKTAGNGLQFSLREQPMSQQQTGTDTAQIVMQDEMLPPADVIPQNYGRLAGQGGGLDIRV